MFPAMVATSGSFINPFTDSASVTIEDDQDDDTFVEAFNADGSAISIPLGPYINGIDHASQGGYFGDYAVRNSVTLTIPSGGWIKLKAYDATEGNQGGTNTITFTPSSPVTTPTKLVKSGLESGNNTPIFRAENVTGSNAFNVWADGGISATGGIRDEAGNKILTWIDGTLKYGTDNILTEFVGDSKYAPIGIPAYSYTSGSSETSGSAALSGSSVSAAYSFALKDEDGFEFGPGSFANAGQGGKADAAVQSGTSTVDGLVLEKFGGSPAESGYLLLSGTPALSGSSIMSGSSVVSGSAIFSGSSVISQSASTSGSATVSGSAVVSGSLTGAGNIVTHNVSEFATAAQAVGTTTLYASRNGCALNSNLITGGGSDDTAALQALLDRAPTAGTLEVVLDGPALISQTLIVHSNTTLRCLQGAGVFVAANSNCHILKTDMGTLTVGVNSNIKLLGGVYNGNGQHQSRFTANLNDSSHWWNLGIWIGWAKNVTIEDVTIQDPRTFGLVIMGCEKVTIRNYRLLIGSGWTGDNNHDCLHFWGPVDNCVATNIRSNGDDDVLAFNTNEAVVLKYIGEYWNASPTPKPGVPFPASGGNLTNIFVENVFFDSSRNGIRFIGGTDVSAFTPNATLCKNIVVRNCYGTISTIPMQFGSWTAGDAGAIDPASTWEIDGWHVTAGSTGSNRIVGYGSTVRLNNIAAGTPVAVQTGFGTGDYFNKPWQIKHISLNQATYASANGGSGAWLVSYMIANVHSGTTSGGVGTALLDTNVNGLGVIDVSKPFEIHARIVADWSLLSDKNNVVLRAYYKTESAGVQPSDWALPGGIELRFSNNGTHPTAELGCGLTGITQATTPIDLGALGTSDWVYCKLAGDGVNVYAYVRDQNINKQWTLVGKLSNWTTFVREPSKLVFTSVHSGTGANANAGGYIYECHVWDGAMD